MARAGGLADVHVSSLIQAGMMLLCCGWMGCPEGAQAPGSQVGCYLVYKTLSLCVQGLSGQRLIVFQDSCFSLLMGSSAPLPWRSVEQAAEGAVKARMGSLECFGMVLSANT